MYDSKQILTKILEINQTLKTKFFEFDDLNNQYLNYISQIKQYNNRIIDQTKNVVEQIKPIIQNICIIDNDFKLENEFLSYQSQLEPIISYNAINLEKICLEQVNNCYQILKELLASQISLDKTLSLCRSYNTLVDITLQKEIIPQDNVGADKFSHIADLKQNILDLEKKICQLFTEFKAQSKLNFDDEFTLNNEYLDELCIQIGKCSVDDHLELPLLWDLQNEVAVVIEASDSCDMPLFNDFLQTLVYRFLGTYPPNDVRLLILDPTVNDFLLAFYGAFHEQLPTLCFHSKKALTENSSEDIFSSLNELDQLIINRLSLIGKANCQNILMYNAQNPTNPQPLILVILYNYPQMFENGYEYLNRLFKNSLRAGVYYIIIPKSLSATKQLPQLNELPGKVITFNTKHDQIALTYQTRCFDEVLLLDHSKVLELLHSSISDATVTLDLAPIISQEEVLNNINHHEYSKVLSIPLGKKESGTFWLNLDSESDAHVVISGTTGSGKSSLLNTIIMSLSLLYSPREVEINLVSMVKSEFEVYKDLQLPHLKTLVTKNDIVGAMDVLNYLQDLMQSRLNIVGSDIVSYNAKVDDAAKLPRTVIIIDEYQRLITDDEGLSVDVAINRLRSIAQLGRSCGISLILCSQTVPIGFRNDLALFRHLFEFRSSSLGNLIPDITYRKGELEGQTGLCFYNLGNQIDRCRIAFVGKPGSGEFNNYLTIIKNKYPNDSMILKSEIKELYPTNLLDLPFLSRFSKKEYHEDGIVRIRLGQKYLSNLPLEYQFNYQNNILYLCGEYLLTKNMEASIIKDFLYLSKDETLPIVYYVDLNRNLNWLRKKTIIHQMRDYWLTNTQGRFRYYTYHQWQDCLHTLEELCTTREQMDYSNDLSIAPVLVIITCCEQLNHDDYTYDQFENLLSRGKHCNLYFVLQMNEYTRYPYADITNAILVPDDVVEGEIQSSSNLLNFLAHTKASESGAKEMLQTLIKKPLDHRLHLLCVNNEVRCFMPYILKAEILKKE